MFNTLPRAVFFGLFFLAFGASAAWCVVKFFGTILGAAGV